MDSSKILMIVVIGIVIYIIVRYLGNPGKSQNPTETFSSDPGPAPLEQTEIEVEETRRPSIWNYYGNSNDYLMDLVANGKKIRYQDTKGFYCDRPNRNRNFLVNPIITQKNIFIKPNLSSTIPAHKLHWNGPDAVTRWADSAVDVHPELEWQIDPVYGLSGENIFYSNFTDTVDKLKNGKMRLWADDYKYRCGLTDCNAKPVNTFNNNY
jgi:hypothetical protein